MNIIKKIILHIIAVTALFFTLSGVLFSQGQQGHQITDIDGNYYDIVTISSPTYPTYHIAWMAENLKTTRYNDTTPLNYPGDNNSDWEASTIGSYAWYNNDEATFKNTYGALYNWYVVNSSYNVLKEVCPTGWREAGYGDWIALVDIFGGESVAGGKLKATGTIEGGDGLWHSPNTDATNEAGFSALPGGRRLPDGSFEKIGTDGYWRVTKIVTEGQVVSYTMNYNSASLVREDVNEAYGYSIRCVHEDDIDGTLYTTPTLTTAIASSITETGAQSGGNITDDGNTPTIDSRGVCWSTSHNPTIANSFTSDGSETGSFTSDIAGLVPNTTYYVRAYATNSIGTAYGNEISFTTYKSDAITDIEGNYYNIITIGSQVWMAENLTTTRYANGDAIPTTPGSHDDISGESEPKYQWLSPSHFGRFYTWYAINDSRNVCPENWHVPSDVEWTILSNYLGGESVAGSKMKAIGNNWFHSNCSNGNNESGFTALPAGFRTDHDFEGFTYNAFFWSSTYANNSNAWSSKLYACQDQLTISEDLPGYGYSVRCVKDGNPAIVTNTNDVGEGSLRNAIEYANSTIGVKDTITFNISGPGPFTIKPVTPFPEITDPVIIDGYSQPGASPATAYNPAIIKIEIDGENLSSGTSGLRIRADNCMIKGLNINRFKADAILIGSSNESSFGNNNTIAGNYIGTDITGKNVFSENVFSEYQNTGIAVNKDNNRIGGNLPSERNIICGNIDGIAVSHNGNSILGNYIGVDVSGKLPLGNYRGIYVNVGTNNIIGGAGSGERNIVSSNATTGISIAWSSTGNKIIGNYIGVDVTGHLHLGNGDCGIGIMNGASDNIIGGSNPGEGNIISDNSNEGILIKFTSTDNAPRPSQRNKIQGNYIGTDASGTESHSNGKNGIKLDEYAINNQIGGTESGAANIIAFNGNSGVLCTGVTNPSSGNSILSNSIYSNTGLGIDLGNDGVTSNDNSDNDTGANNLQNYPLLSSVSFSPGKVNIIGSFNSNAGRAYTIQYFASKMKNVSGFGEGETFLGSETVNTNSSGNAAINTSFAINGASGQVITATATDPDGNTSEFSNAVGGLADLTVGSALDLHYVYNETGAEKITDGSDITAITNAFQTWTNIPTAGISFKNDGPVATKYANASDGINLVSFVDDQYDWTPGVLAYSARMVDMEANGGKGKITDADIIVNPEFANVLKGTVTENDAGTEGYYDIQSILTHEIGHNLGLLHSCIVNSTMFYWLDKGKTDERKLKPDDVAWASYMYPGGSYSTSYGTISGDITYGYDPNPKVVGAFITATNVSSGDQFHSYSEENGKYVVPVSAPAGSDSHYYIDIQPLDGSVNGFQITPANISNYIFSNTVYFDYPNEFYNSGESNNDDVNAKTAVPVSSGSETSGINIITNIDNIPPTVLSITPVSGTKVEILPDIIIKFSEPVDITSFTDASCYLQSGDNKYFGSYAKLGGNSDAIIFTPKNPLPYSTTFILHLIGQVSSSVKGITDLRGNELDVSGLAPYNIITINADNVPPTILSTVPASGATGVFVTDKISVFFSEPMNKTSVQNNFTVTGGGTSIAGSFSWNNELTAVTFTPSKSLSENTSYTLTLIDKISDLMEFA